jgi:putrescine aminotransferase
MEHYQVLPDVMLLAKGITSGYIPLGAVILSEDIHQELIRSTEGVLPHGYTYSGHAAACAVALKNIEILESEKLVENARLMGDEMLKGLRSLQQEIDIVGEVRALGLIGALEIINPAVNGRFSAPVAPQVSEEAAKRGLIVRTVTFEEMDTIVFAPPLIINSLEVEKMLDMLKQSLLAVQKRVMARNK